MDDFRVVPSGGKPSLLLKIAPAISPIFGNNPGYQVYQYDRAVRQPGELPDLLPVEPLHERSSPRFRRRDHGALEYDFRQAYAAEAVNAREVARLADRMRCR